ncbi:uncharacterized protein LOC130281862 [Hyla sarda]|uniref:uncharacterized protein LOC130281862 n=1 Tax=Hyla sarda TaxID=327740 RepID=UPI0024C43EBC|nr:uncharacterized protein LOC130281862 [Hyla sarda]XP_056385572.1 uncharacterized protein LOC130281862 [Hyla sarda]XP_056385573.1 uncharacterized protein LOC130281862 [Hyla sarda]
MESLLDDDQGPEQEASSSQRTLTSTCRRTKETDQSGLSYETAMELDSDLQDNLQPPALEMLTSEIVNPGTQASVSSCHKVLSQGSPDVSPSNNNTQEICNATLLGGLEPSHAVVEPATEDRHIKSEMRNLQDGNETETSSDETDEWETASEESVELNPEPHDKQRVKEDTGPYGQKKHNEDAGPYGPKTTSEDTGLYSHETLTEDTGPHDKKAVNEEAGPHGQEKVSDGHKTKSEEAGPHDKKTVDEEAGPCCNEKMGEDTGSHGHETVSEDTEVNEQERMSEGLGPHGQEKHTGDAGLHSQEMLNEETGLYGLETLSVNDEPFGHEMLKEDAELNDQETVSEEDRPHGHDIAGKDVHSHSPDTISEETLPHSPETVSEEAEPHKDKTVGEEAEPHRDETGVEEAEPHRDETGVEEAEPHRDETGVEEADPHRDETICEEAEPHRDETGVEEAEPHWDETICEEAEPHRDETVDEEADPHRDETVNEVAEQHRDETVGEEAEPHRDETVNEVAEPHRDETIGEETEPHRDESVSEEAEANRDETVGEEAESHSEEAGPHGHETASIKSSPLSLETVNEVDDLNDLEPVREEILLFELQQSSKEADPLSHGDIETDNREDTLHSPATYHDNTRSCHQEKVNAEAGPHDREMVSQETGSYDEEKTRPPVHETIGNLTGYLMEEIATELVRALGNEVVGDMARPHSNNADIQIQDNEKVSGRKNEECDEDQALNDIIVTVNEETTDDDKETFSTERQDINQMSNSEDILKMAGVEIDIDSRRDGNVSEESFSDGNDGTHGCYSEGVCPEMQGIYDTAGKNALQETSEPKDTKGGDINTGIVEISEGMDEVQQKKRINTEPSTEEKEMAKEQAQVISSGDCEHHEELSKDSRVLDESAIDEELNSHDTKQKCDSPETSNEPELTKDIEIAYLEYEALEEKPHSIKTLVGTGEGPFEVLPNTLNQETVLELQYNTIVTTDAKSYMGCAIDLDAQLNVSGPKLREETGEGDYANTLSDTKTKSIEPEYVRPTETQNELYNNLGPSYNAEPEVQVVTFDGQDINGSYLQLTGSLTEKSTYSMVDSSIGLQNQDLGDLEPHWEDVTTVEMLDPYSSQGFSQVDQSTSVPPDERDHYKLNFFPIKLKDVGFVPEDLPGLSLKSKVNHLLPESINTEVPTQVPLQESVTVSVHQESILGDNYSVFDIKQDTMCPGSETAETSPTVSENTKLIKRQRSNTDPYPIRDQDEKLQDISNTESFSRGRLRSLTPPCDKFTTSYPSAPQTVEQSTTSVLYKTPDENKSSHREKDTSAKTYNFYPTQIFNPMLLLGHSMEESGFYQEKPFREHNTENAGGGQFQTQRKDNQVPLHTQDRKSVVKEPKPSFKSTEESNNTKPMTAPSVAPVWLPPHPTRYGGSSERVNEIRSMKPSENPLVRRATIRHKKSNVGVKPTTKRFSNPSLPAIPQKDYSMAPKTSSLPRVQPMNVNRIQISSKNRNLPHQQKISEEPGQSRLSPSMETLREEGYHTVKEKPSNSPESVLLRGSRSKNKPPSSDSSQSIHRRYSTFINSSNLLYQEYSDVALNQEIQRQKPGDSPAEESQPSSPRVRRRILSSQDSYLQRLSISSADSLWQDIPKIRDSVTFLSMTREEQKLQEAKFELIMSEALYLRSLNIAVDHFQRSTELQEVLSAQDRQWLFSRLSEVRDASADFLFDLEEEFESNIYNFQVCDVVMNHEPNFRRVYLPYVTNQSYQDRTYQTLMNGNPRFQQVLAKLESDPVCQRLSLKSFLILPFQRITRLRLLLQNILKRSAPGSTEELQATEAHNALEKLIRDCNESVQRMKDTEELILLNQKIQFECKIFPLISQSRRLVKHGEVTSLEFNSMSFKWKVTTRPVYLHLFNDCLLLSRVREGGRFVVFDHSSDFRVERCEIKLHTNQKNIFRVFLRDSAAMGRESSQDVRETEYIFRTETQSQKLRWICALSPRKQGTDFFRDHGLSQMQCLKSYKARENDELSLEKADILMITQNSDDGWLHGIRLSDQQSGWFPHANVQTISRNACLRNLQEEQRLQAVRAKLQPTGNQGTATEQ